MLRYGLAACVLILAFSCCRADTLLRGLGPEPDSLDIHQAQGLSAINLLRDVHQGLLTVDVTGAPAPGVAASWEISLDNLVYRFKLRTDACWSDGRPITAADFIRGWRRALDPASGSATAVLLDQVKNAISIRAGEMPPESLGIDLDPDGRLRVTLERPLPWLPYLLSHPVTYPLHADASPQPRNGPFSGAYRIAGWVPQSQISLQKNPHFWDRESVAIDAVSWLPIEDPAAELNRYRSGELHITETIPPGRYRWLSRNYGNELRTYPYLGSFFLGLNLRQGPLSRSAELRQALAYAIDRDKLTRLVLKAGEQAAFSLIPPGLGVYQPQPLDLAGSSQAEREAAARELYRQAGYSDKRRLRLQLRFNTSTTHRRIAVAVAAMWKQVLGVRTELINEEWKVFVNNRRQGVVTQVFRGGWIADYPDPHNFFLLFQQGTGLNWSGYQSSEFEQRLAQAAATRGEQRLAALQQAERILMQDMPIIPLYYYVSRHLVRPEVQGFEPNVQDIHLSQYMSLQP